MERRGAPPRSHCVGTSARRCCRRYLVNWLPTIKLCAFIFIYLHLVTCVWHGLQVGSLSLPHERSWLDVDAPADYLESRSLVQYVTSFHVVLNINLGNGINPRNATENVFSVFNLLIGAFLFAMLFGTLAGCPVRALAPSPPMAPPPRPSPPLQAIESNRGTYRLHR
jgi:hypothetical protein